MTITNTWVVAKMDAYPELNDETNVVFNVHWRLAGTDGTYTADVYGSVSVPVDPDTPFTPYADLTHEQVVGWVQSALGDENVAACEAKIAKRIADQINPPVVTPPLPWD